jgi:hypothetical protein
MTEEALKKLYTRTTCVICLNKTYNCPYCNGEGTVYVEASDKTVAEWINTLAPERQKDIIENIVLNTEEKE